MAQTKQAHETAVSAPSDLTPDLTEWETEAQNLGTCQSPPGGGDPRDIKHSPLWLSVGAFSTTLRGPSVLPVSEAGTEAQRGIGPFSKSHSFAMAESGGGLGLLSPPAWDYPATVLPETTLEWFQQKPGQELGTGHILSGSQSTGSGWPTRGH